MSKKQKEVNKKVADISKIIQTAKQTKFSITPDKRGKNPIPKEKEETIITLSDSNSYEFVFERKEQINEFSPTRMDTVKYELIKKLGIIHKIQTQMIIDNIITEWIERNRKNIEKDMKKFSKF